MCGIGGILAYRNGDPVDRAVLDRLGRLQRHRGPDDRGSWVSPDGRTGLVHQRLSIVDLTRRGRQPMSLRDARLHVVFNGEIYNYPALRETLEDRGHRFASNSDTEVLLHGYREWGRGLLDRLRGMFAFALHDEEGRKTLLARDLLGIKPLYWSDDSARLIFASEIQALRATHGAAEVDPGALVSYLRWGSIAPPRTLYKPIRALPPGNWMEVRTGGSEGPRRYAGVHDFFSGANGAARTSPATLVRDALEDTVSRHLMADVPVGVFLSGGVDSSVLAATVSEVSDRPACTVTLGFDSPDLDESAYARRAAREFGTRHSEIRITAGDVRSRMAQAVAALDQPSVDGINTYFVSEAAARAGLKVVLSGVGSDELFGGYPSFRWVPRILALHSMPLLRSAYPAAARLVGLIPGGRGAAKLKRILGSGSGLGGAYHCMRGLFGPKGIRSLLSESCKEQLADERTEAAPHTWLNMEGVPKGDWVSVVEIGHYLQEQLLRDTDAVSMRHSIEVRTPFVDVEFMRSVAAIPSAERMRGPAKKLLREATRKPLPECLWKRKKQGFTLPFEQWLRSGALPVDLPEHPMLRREGVAALADAFHAGRVHWSRLWAVLVLGAFLD